MRLAAIFVGASALACSVGVSAGTVEKMAWGKTPQGEAASIFVVREGAVRLKLSDYGGRMVALEIPGRDGQVGNVLVSAGSPDQMTGLWAVAGATMGRYANRIGGGTFAIDGHQYELDRNQRGNTIHGGSRGFGSRLWSARPIHNGVEMKLVSADGDMGFPGTLAVTLRYVLHAERGRAWVDVRMSAKTTRATHVNFTNHAVFNLDGAGAGFGEQRLRVAASRFTPTGENGLPTGQVAPIAGQPFDLRQPAAIAGLPAAGTVDANMVLDNGGRFAPVAWIDAPASGRSMTLSTSEPGMQLFVPAKLPAAGGQAMGSGLCLEPQHFPDTPHNANFPATLLRPGKIRTWQTRYDFRFPDVRAAGRKT